MGKLLLDGCYASGVFTLDDVYYPLGKAELFLLNGHAVTDNVDRYAGINISKHVKVKVDKAVDLYYVFLAQFLADAVFDYSHGAVQLFKPEHLIEIHALSGLYMVDNDTVFYRIYGHFYTSIPSILSISAILIYFPLSACLK